MAPALGLLTDHYELTMVQAALRSGAAERPCTFEVFARSLPAGRRFGVVGGLGRLLDALPRFRFGPDEVAHLADTTTLDDATLAYLAAYRFGGDVDAYAEGETWFPGSPVLVATGGFAEAVLLETLVLSVLNHDSAVAAAAARMVAAADGRPVVEMGGRRTHEEAAVAAARTAVLCGFTWTSNLEAGRRHGVPTSGTAAHAFTLVHDDERSAFAAQVAALGPGTTLLVDTYDVEEGIRLAVEVCRAAGATGPGAVRIDSGDLAALAVAGRAQLDALGAARTRITVTGDLDEGRIAAIVAAGAPVDAFGVGTSLVTGSGHPAAGFVYKLVEHDHLPVAKRSTGKATVAGRKHAVRALGADGRAVAEVLGVDRAPVVDGPTRALHVPVVRGGEVVHRPTNAEVLAHHRAALAELPAGALDLAPGAPALTVGYA